MRDVNGSSFHLLLQPADWTDANGQPAMPGMSWNSGTFSLAGKQNWRLPQNVSRTAALAAVAASKPVVADEFGVVARIKADGSGVESLDGTNWVPLTDSNSGTLQPKIGHFVAMALGAGRLALLSTDGTQSYLELFDLRQRWPLDSPENPALPLSLDPGGNLVAVAPDGTIFVLVASGLAICEGGPILEFVPVPTALFVPVAPNPDPLRVTRTVINRPQGTPIAMTADATRVAIMCDHGTEPQTIVFLDRTTGLWSSVPVSAQNSSVLPYMTDLGLLEDGLIGLLAPANPTSAPADCAVVSVLPSTGVALAAYRYPMLNQYAPRFAAVPGPEVFYLGTPQVVPPGIQPVPVPRRLLPLPYPAYLLNGALGRFDLPGHDADLVWHRLYVEATLPAGTGLVVWARCAEQSWAAAALAGTSSPTPAQIAAADAEAAADQAALIALLQHATPDIHLVTPAAATAIAGANSLPAPSPTLLAALGTAPFHRQPPLVAGSLPSELPFHPGLAAQSGKAGSLLELLLQRADGKNRRLNGGLLDVVVLASGDGRHSPCVRAVRVYTPRFCYQDEYLPRLYHQTAIAIETDTAPQASPPDFRERLLASLEGLLTPIENRVAAAEYLLDPAAVPAPMLPWLASYMGLTLDPGWPEARRRRALASAGRQLRQRGTYRGVCLAVDIATDGAVQRGEVVLLETHRLRRTDATILGIPLGGLNVLTRNGVPSGNSIIGDTLILSPEWAIDLASLLVPTAPGTTDPAAAARFLDEYADRVQVAAILQSAAAVALRPAVQAVLQAELPAQLNFEIVVAENRFVLGLSPLLDIDTFLEPPTLPAPLTLDVSVIGRDAIVRDPPALRP